MKRLLILAVLTLTGCANQTDAQCIVGDKDWHNLHFSCRGSRCARYAAAFERICDMPPEASVTK